MKNEDTDPTGREQKTTVMLEASLPVVWEYGHSPNISGTGGDLTDLQVQFTKWMRGLGVNDLFTMHGPDGMTYANRTIFRDVIKHRRIVHEHFDPNFIATIDFLNVEEKTALTWYSFTRQRNCLIWLKNSTKQMKDWPRLSHAFNAIWLTK